MVVRILQLAILLDFSQDISCKSYRPCNSSKKESSYFIKRFNLIQNDSNIIIVKKHVKKFMNLHVRDFNEICNVIT